MRFALGVLLCTLVVAAEAPTGTVVFQPGKATGKIDVDVADPPAPGDLIGIDVSSNALRVTLVLPGGRKIKDEQSAEAAGLRLEESSKPEPFGSTDGGRKVYFHFTKPGVKGRYAVEFSAAELKEKATGEAWFVSQKKRYYEMVPQLRGTIMPPAAALAHGALIGFDLDRDEEAGIFDVLVPDASVKVSLKLPDGRVLEPGQSGGQEFEWKTVAKAADIDPPGAWFGISGLLLPEKGTHHVISFALAKKGHYELRAAGKSGEVRTAFFPFGRGLKEDTQAMAQNAGRIPPGEVRISVEEFPPHCYAQDKLDLVFSVAGDPAPSSTQVEVKYELRTYKPYSGSGPMELGPPVVETIATAPKPDEKGAYHVPLTPKAPGVARILIEAKGENAAGVSFDEGSILNLNVSPLVARFVSLDWKPMDTNANGKADRLDVTATLDIVKPGEYSMDFTIYDAAHNMAGGRADVQLQAGRQTIKVAIDAKELRTQLKKGPYRIADLRFDRIENNMGDSVDIAQQSFELTGLGPDSWESALIQPEHSAVLRGVQPAASGRFLIAEVEWAAITPGGECSWQGSLTDSSVVQRGQLPPGRSVFRFAFPGAELARSAKKKASLSVLISCGDISNEDFPYPEVSFEPSQFEPEPASLQLLAQEMIQVRPGDNESVYVEAVGPAASQARFSLGDVPLGLTAGIRDAGIPRKNGPKQRLDTDVLVFANPDAQPGRYYIGVSATAGARTAQTAIAVDVVR